MVKGVAVGVVMTKIRVSCPLGPNCQICAFDKEPKEHEVQGCEIEKCPDCRQLNMEREMDWDEEAGWIYDE